MALTGSETFGTIIPGFVTDTNGNLSCTATVSGSSWREGFLRDTDGRLVVTDSATGATWQNGFLRGTSGELVYTLNSGDYGVVPGFKTATNGALCFSVEPSSQAWQNGFLVSTSGYLAATGVTPYAVAVRALSPSFFLSLGSQAGLTDLSGNGRNGTGAGSITIGSQTGPLVRGDGGATLFDGTDDRITTTWETRTNLARKPLTQSGAPVASGLVNATVAAVAGTGQSGNDYLTRATLTAATTGGVYQNSSSECALVSAGTQVTASVNVLAIPAGRTVQVAINWWDASNVNLGSPAQTTTTVTGRVSVTGTAPTDTAKALVSVYIMAGAIGESVDFDGILIEATSTAKPFFPTSAQLSSGESGWTGTSYASTSMTGPFANGTSRTFMGWVNRGTETDEDTMLASAGGGSEPYAAVLVTAAEDLRLVVDSGASKLLAATGAFTGKTGVWTHIAATYDGVSGAAELYVNGSAAASSTITPGFPTPTSSTMGSLLVGSYRSTWGMLSGNLAWVSVHGRALTSGEILNAYQAGAT